MLQDVLAPIVLENLDCAGTETRLLDCPGSMDVVETVFTDYFLDEIRFSFQYYGEFSTFCDPLRGTFAFVACGETVGPGVTTLVLCFHCFNLPGVLVCADFVDCATMQSLTVRFYTNHLSQQHSPYLLCVSEEISKI